jgi:UPF0755 protein
MKLRFLVACVLLIVLVAVGLGAAYSWFTGAVMAPGPLRNATTLVIAPGSGVPVIGRQLAQAGVIERSWMFELETRRLGKARALKAGEYRFDPGISMDAAIDKLVKREIVVHNVTIPEGLVAADIKGILTAAEFLTGDITTPIADGDLLPETYRYERGDTRDAVVARMKAARATVLNTLWNDRAADLPLRSPEEALVLASIVEKETGIASERAHVASVFINRLRKGMRLQSDPTVIYGIAPTTGGLDRPLRRADLEASNNYNTYVIAGLPPSPICNPGRAAIAAVLAPATTDDLYFVADGTGGHVFAKTLDEHNRNVARWRQIQNQSR